MGKSVLIKSVCSAISAFYMQCLPLPKGTCEDIDKCIRNFFWESAEGKQKIHLINWNTLTSPTKDGGLGFFNSFYRNQALLGKLYWRMMQESNSPWAIISNHRLKIGAKHSTIRKCLVRGKSVFDKWAKYIINTGLVAFFWNDRWLPQGPLSNILEGPLPIHDSNMKVAAALDLNGNWIWNNISYPIPSDIMLSMISLPRNPLGGRHDQISWEPNIDGKFSLKTAYMLASKVTVSPPQNINWIWQIQCHPRHKLFCLFLWHYSLPTNTLLNSRGINIPRTCVLCGDHDETAEHLFKTCTTSHLIWSQSQIFPSPSSSSLPFSAWFKFYASCQEPSLCNVRN